MIAACRYASVVLLLGTAASIVADFEALDQYVEQTFAGRVPARLALFMTVAAAGILGTAAAWSESGRMRRWFAAAVACFAIASTLFGLTAHANSFGCGCTSIPLGWTSTALWWKGCAGVGLALFLFFARPPVRALEPAFDARERR